ncbi:MAG: portal protein, partial [Pseudomonadota bacterium]|nr:portal protein [Pseudomonadota bacterium]
QYDFLYDNQFAELKESEMMNERLGLAATVEPYLGKYYSTEYLRKKVLRQSDTEIKEIDEQIAQEIKDGILPDPNSVDPITGEPLEGGGGDLGNVPVEDDLESQGAVTDADLAKDTKSAEI